MATLKGIDVSSNNGTLDWNKIKSQIDFAIIRIGYGSDSSSQDDKQAARNLSECERLGIPYGVYIYSYALNIDNVVSEATHTKRMIKGHNPKLGVFFDMEDADGYKQKHNLAPHTHGSLMTDFCVRWLQEMNGCGYPVGVYANKDYFTNVLDINKIRNTCNAKIWTAAWGPSSCPISNSYMWQYTSDGKVNGNGISRMDMNYLYESTTATVTKPTTTTTTKKSNEEIANEVIAGKWSSGSERKTKLEAAGYNYTTIQNIVNEKLAPAKKSNEEIANEVLAGKWGNGSDRKAKLEAAGYNYTTIQNIVNGKVTPAKKTNEQIAREIINGTGNWGTGETRKQKLKAAGYDASAVQSIINKLLS